MVPLRVQAKIQGAIAMPYGPIALDALLAAQVCIRDNIIPCTSVAEVKPIEIPVMREPKGRFHLASCSVAVVEKHKNRFMNRRFPIEEAQMFGDKTVRRLNISGGPAKSYRLPIDTVYLVDDTLTWWCIGAEAEVQALMSLCLGLGKKRSVGLGTVRQWLVEPCTPWDNGFPVVLDGKPLRNLPLDWPGLVDPDVGYGNLTYPYPVALNPNEVEVARP